MRALTRIAVYTGSKTMGSPAESPDRLDSWKVIADYLDRDVATVRRWEKSLGLPVRRVPGGRGRSVFAFKTEIDEWLRRASHNGNGASASSESIPAGGPADTSVTARAVVPDEARRPVRWRWPTAAAAIVALAAGILWWSLTPSAHDDTLAVEVTATGVVARMPDGSERWRHAFHADARASVDTTRADDGVVPVNGRVPGYVAGVMYSTGVADESPRGGELLWLTRDGALHRRFTFDDRLQFGGEAYEGPWVLADFRAHPQRGAARMAVVGRHFRWWPSAVTLLDEQWLRTQTFVNAGWVQRVSWLSPDRLLIAGFNNARDGGMVAILDAGAMHGQSPSAGKPAFECLSCGSAMPLRYVVLPRSEINVVTASPFNGAIVEAAPDRIIVRTLEEQRTTGQVAEALYEFSPGLELRSASYGDRYWDTHRALELEGKLDHPRGRCPDRHGPPFIEVWERAGGWRRIVPR
jgi:hypothetical protein